MKLLIAFGATLVLLGACTSTAVAPRCDQIDTFTSCGDKDSVHLSAENTSKRSVRTNEAPTNKPDVPSEPADSDPVVDDEPPVNEEPPVVDDDPKDKPKGKKKGKKKGNASANNGKGGNYDKTGHKDNKKGNGKGRR